MPGCREAAPGRAPLLDPVNHKQAQTTVTHTHLVLAEVKEVLPPLEGVHVVSRKLHVRDVGGDVAPLAALVGGQRAAVLVHERRVQQPAASDCRGSERGSFALQLPANRCNTAHFLYCYRHTPCSHQHAVLVGPGSHAASNTARQPGSSDTDEHSAARTHLQSSSAAYRSLGSSPALDTFTSCVRESVCEFECTHAL